MIRTILLLALLAAATTTAAEDAAARDAATIRTELDSILASPDFGGVRETRAWRYTGDPLRDPEQEPPESAPEADADAGSGAIGELLVTIASRAVELALWLALAVVVVLLIVYRERWLGALQGLRERTLRETLRVEEGADAIALPLPEDPAAAALALWRAGDARGCVSLLYRGAVTALRDAEGVELAGSATEWECVRTVHASVAAPTAAFFRDIALARLEIAYGHRMPDDVRMEALCTGWAEFFGAAPR